MRFLPGRSWADRTLAERARSLVAVADPAFRAELEQASERLV